jgi:hypothetical protein
MTSSDDLTRLDQEDMSGSMTMDRAGLERELKGNIG